VAVFDASALQQIFSWQSAAWTSTAVLLLFVVRMWNGAPAMLDRWLAFRTAKANEKSADWTRLRDEINRLNAWCHELQEAVDECRQREAEWMSRAVTAEATLQGYGEWRQIQAVREASKRLGKPIDGDGE
jgi:hypothetical protein